MSEAETVMRAVTQAVVEAAKALIYTHCDRTTESGRLADANPGHPVEAETTGRMTEGLRPRQLTFNWVAKNKHTELQQFDIEVTNIFLLNIMT